MIKGARGFALAVATDCEWKEWRRQLLSWSWLSRFALAAEEATAAGAAVEVLEAVVAVVVVGRATIALAMRVGRSCSNMGCSQCASTTQYKV